MIETAVRFRIASNTNFGAVSMPTYLLYSRNASNTATKKSIDTCIKTLAYINHFPYRLPWTSSRATPARNIENASCWRHKCAIDSIEIGVAKKYTTARAMKYFLDRR